MKAALITVNILLALLVVWAGIRRLESFSGKKTQEFTVKKRTEKKPPQKEKQTAQQPQRSPEQDAEVVIAKNLFSQDRMSHWDAFSAALPDGRRSAVRARYLFTLLLSVCCVLFAAAVSGLLYAFGLGTDTGLAELLVSGSASVALCLFFTAVLLPLLYRFGPEKARFIIILIYLILLGLVVGFFSLIPEAVIDDIGKNLHSLLPLLALLLLASLYGSYRLSLSIVRRQEF